ncbi:MAG: autotransporter domain-containing protein [Hellea sp.]
MTTITSTLRASKLLLGSVSGAAMLLAFTPSALAQTVVNDARTAPVETDGEDVTIESTGSVTLENAGPAVVLNSDNTLTNAGSITINDVDNATGVSLEGGASRSFINSGSISIREDFTPSDTDGDNLVDGPFAQGSGRTGILISGASPFEGNIELATSSAIDVEGNDSFGINLTNTAMAQNGLTGNLSQGGVINVTGDNATGVNIGSGISGDFAQNGNINIRGEGGQAVNIDADIQGGFVNSGAIANTGYRFTTRPGLANSTTGALGRDTLRADSLLQAGSAISVNGDIGRGIYLDDNIDDVLDEDGNQTFDDDGNVIQRLGTISSIVQNGSAPAILINGEGTPVAIGRVSPITDPDADGFDADLQYAFVNQGTVQANGLYDDIDATTFSVSDATLTGGINNTGTMSATAFVAPIEVPDRDAPADDPRFLTEGDGNARVIVLGSNAIAERINNSGLILASSSEAADIAFANPDSIPLPRSVLATAIDIEASAQLSSLTNSGAITAVLVGREGTAYAIRDQSGTLISLSNTGSIGALGSSSDPTGNSGTNFTLVALDASQNVDGFTFVQNRAEDTNMDDDITPADPNILGDIRLGSGDDSITITAGNIIGGVDFGGGNDALTLSGSSTVRGALANQGGLDISVAEGSTLALTAAGTIPATSVAFDGTSTYSPVLDGSNGIASTLMASGDIGFEAGATIAPTLTNVVGIDRTEFLIAQAGGTLTVADLATLASAESPYLFNTNYTVEGNDLVITLDLRNASELGLDQVQSLAYTPAVQALRNNTELGDAFANITSQSDFNAAYNQILPEFSAAARQFVIANVDGATGAVANHLDSVRRSPDKPGGAWLQEFAYFADRDLAGLSEQYRGAGFGFSAGLDTAIGPFHAVGVNLGFASTEIEDVVGIDEPLDVVTVQGGAYAGWASGKLSVDAYAGGGYNDFEQNRRVRINTFSGDAQGDWSGTHLNGSIRAGYDLELNDKFWFRPTVSVDYLRLSEKAYTETGDSGLALSVDKRVSTTGSATAMFNFGAKFQGKRTWIRPSIRAGYRQEFLKDPVNTSFRFTGLLGEDGQAFNSETAMLQSLLFPDSGFVVGFSVAAGSAYSSIGFDFDSDIRDGFIRHTGRVVVRLLF